MEFGLSDTSGLLVERKMTSRHSSHVHTEQGEELMHRDLELFMSDLLLIKKAAIHQAVGLSDYHSLQKMF